MFRKSLRHRIEELEDKLEQQDMKSNRLTVDLAMLEARFLKVANSKRVQKSVVNCATPHQLNEAIKRKEEKGWSFLYKGRSKNGVYGVFGR